MGPQLKVSSDRLVKPGIEHATPGLQGKRLSTTPQWLLGWAFDCPNCLQRLSADEVTGSNERVKARYS